MKKIGFIILVLIIASCQKDDLPGSNIGAPVFVSDVIFNDTDYRLTAGENGLVLNPIVSLTDSSTKFVSELSNPSCTDCGPALKMTIESPPFSNPNTTQNWLGELTGWDYALEVEPGESTQALKVLASNGNDVSTGHWFLDGEQLSNEETSAIELSIEAPGSYELGYSDNTCIDGEPITIDYESGEIPCYGSISQSATDPNLFIAEPGPAYGTSAAFIWIIDGSITGTGDNTIVADINTTNQVSVIMVGATGCIDTVTYIPQSPLLPCANNLRIENSEVVTVMPEPVDEALVTIEFTDAEGTMFSSSGPQGTSTFQLVSIDPYEEPNRPNETFANAVFDVSCILYSDEGQGFSFSGQINLALDLPN